VTRSIVITTIHAPSRAVREFARRNEWQTIVVADRKTPPDWRCDGVQLVSVDDQLRSEFELARVLPWNHYARKMLGYLEAAKAGAAVVVDTDDDNIPKDDWDVLDFDGASTVTKPDRGFVNLYEFFGAPRAWPRGLPLDRIRDPDATLADDDLETAEVTVGIWQGLADVEPDVDAIYRLVVSDDVVFADRDPVVLARGTLSPFNSQNTAFRRELLPLLFLPTTATFRFTDILRGLVAQPIMWAAGYLLGFTRATVVQDRNPHDLLRDFESEIPAYLYPARVVETVTGAVDPAADVRENLRTAYEALVRDGVVAEAELEVVAAWLRDLERLGA
jgi:hypothetical protein